MNTRCFVCADGHIWSINHEGVSNHPGDIEIVGDTVRILGEKDDLGPGRAIDEEYVLWPSLTALATALEQESDYVAGQFSVDQYRSDLRHQLSIPDDLDWDYIVATAIKGQLEATRTGVNMTPDLIDQD